MEELAPIEILKNAVVDEEIADTDRAKAIREVLRQKPDAAYVLDVVYPAVKRLTLSDNFGTRIWAAGLAMKLEKNYRKDWRKHADNIEV